MSVYTVEIGHGKQDVVWKPAVGTYKQGRRALEFKTVEHARSYIIENVYTTKVRIRHPDGKLEAASFRDIIRY